MWTNVYEDLLAEWAELRATASKLPLEEALLMVQDWWDTAPICNQHFHILDTEEWPLPWDLLAETCFCDLAKCIGICYTVILLENEDIKSLHIVETDNYTLVQVNDGQYTLNNEPGEITANQADLRIGHSVDCEFLKNRLK